jgi:GT2 family glycosyltransferase
MGLVLAENEGDASLLNSINAFGIQSCPYVRVVVVAAPGIDIGRLSHFLSHAPVRVGSLDIWPDLSVEREVEIQKARYITFLRHGDILHPSAAAWLAIYATRADQAGNAPDQVIVWGELQPDGCGRLAWAQRNPSLQRETLLHYPYVRNAFAFSSDLLSAYPGDLHRELTGNSLHLFQIWLAYQGQARWTAHPEYFLLRSPSRLAERPDSACTMAFQGNESTYRKMLAEVAGSLEFKVRPGGSSSPFVLRPRNVPGTVSVIILFRDKPDLTIRALRSVAKQSHEAFLEVVLVNNQSSDHSLKTLAKELRQLGGAISSWKIINYDRPFNHSAQCNIGFEASLGDVIIFLNNDCELLSEDAIADMSCWAMWPGIASVGVCMIDPNTGKESSGVEARLGATNYFDSIVEERSGAAFTPFVRECFGNTFACAAVSRSVWENIGGLDALRFPNGYNDVDFVCRTRAKGLRHLALGHIKAAHAPGQSRDRTDESAQKILIRELYPEAVGGLGELIFDETIVRLAQKRTL